MKVVIHGATNLSNFGDILFAHLFYNKCIECGMETSFYSLPPYGIGVFLRKELNYQKKEGVLKFLKNDALVLMSGGYFGEDKKTKINTIKRYFRFFFPARLFMITGKPIYILGVGGGPLLSYFLQKSAVKILNYAKLVYVRDQETKDYFCEYGCNNEIIVTSDTALCIGNYTFPKLRIDRQENTQLNEMRNILLHIMMDDERDTKISELVVPAINRFVDEHSEYGVVVCTDGVPKGDLRKTKSFQAIRTNNKFAFNYKNSLELCSLINSIDVAITMKLHVGIVASALHKSVISFPMHREKVQRFYKQIGESDRCVSFNDISENVVYEKLRIYHQIPIEIPEEIKSLSLMNLEAIESIQYE